MSPILDEIASFGIRSLRFIRNVTPAYSQENLHCLNLTLEQKVWLPLLPRTLTNSYANSIIIYQLSISNSALFVI